MIKNFLYPCIPLVVVVLFISLLCCSSAPKDRVSIINGSTEPTVIKRYPNGKAIYKVEFEGHYYLILNNNGGICHDENCKCKK